jgi:small subunit ribosomal protein S21
MQIMVRDNNVEQALRALKKKLQREGVYREMKLRRHYEKPSEKRAREKAAAVRRARKMERKRMERDGQVRRPFLLSRTHRIHSDFKPGSFHDRSYPRSAAAHRFGLDDEVLARRAGWRAAGRVPWHGS